MKLETRKATLEDCKSIYKWRTDERNSEFSFTGKDFKYEDHVKWFKEYLSERENLMLIAEIMDKPCCVMRFDGDFQEKTVSIYMVPGFHGKGLALSCLLLGELFVKESLGGLKCNLNAEIMGDNDAEYC